MLSSNDGTSVAGKCRTFFCVIADLLELSVNSPGRGLGGLLHLSCAPQNLTGVMIEKQWRRDAALIWRDAERIFANLRRDSPAPSPQAEVPAGTWSKTLVPIKFAQIRNAIILPAWRRGLLGPRCGLQHQRCAELQTGDVDPYSASGVIKAARGLLLLLSLNQFRKLLQRRNWGITSVYHRRLTGSTRRHCMQS